jgi:hypothetical protein
MASTADRALTDAPPQALDRSSATSKPPGVSLNAAGARRTFTVRHTFPLPHVADGGLSASLGVRYDPSLQRRGGGLLRQLGLASTSSSASSPADGAELTAALVWRSRDGLARLSVSDVEATAKQGWRFSFGGGGGGGGGDGEGEESRPALLTGVLSAELRYPLMGTAAARRDPRTGAALPESAPDPGRELFAGGQRQQQEQQRRRAPKISLSVDDVRPLWAYGLAVGGALLLGAPVSLVGKEVTIGLPSAAGLPRRLAGYARGSARHQWRLRYGVDVDEFGGCLEIGPLLKLGGGGR